MTETADCAVIGAGVVGLAIARALALAGREVVVLEAARAVGSEISARNSEVIHAGIYYPTDSLKARLCVAGRRMLYAYARERGIAAEPVGKLIVATGPAETEVLAALKSQAEINGVADLRALTAAEIRGLEPEVEGVAGLMSPSSGIVDSHRLMLSCRGDLEDRGGMIAFASPVEGGEAISGGVRLHVGGAADLALDCRTVVNSAGLAAPGLALSIAGIRTAAVPKGHLAKGNYFRLVGRRAPFRHLVYPVPEPGGLGVHATIDLAGVVRFGPDVQWIDRIDYDVAPERAERFYAAIRRYWPGLADGGLAPDYAGIRPKIAGPGEPAADFVIQDHTAHGVPGLVNLFGIESPGLTAALAIAERVAGLCGARRVDAPSAP